MSELCSNGIDGRVPTRNAAAVRITDGLGLMASPISATMAVLTSMPGGGPAEAFCSSVHASPLGGMTTMYLLMGAFHVAPWIRLVRTRFGDGPRFQPHI